MALDVQYISWGPDTSYRIRNNPDLDAVDGSEGIVLEWQNTGEDEWQGYFFIGPEQALEVAEAIQRIFRKKE